MIPNYQFCNRPFRGLIGDTKRCAMTMILSAVMAVSAGAEAQAEPSEQMKKFLGWNEEAQHAHVGNSILMIAVVASQTAPQIAMCLDEWYGNAKEERQAEAVDVMRELPQYTPESVILAVVEKACGKFPRREP